jgi:hypothetical protein
MKINKKIVIQQQSKLLKVMSAHNPLSAKLAEQAGFDAIWGSGFELSASFAVPDASVLPMSVHLEMMRAIVISCKSVRGSSSRWPLTKRVASTPSKFVWKSSARNRKCDFSDSVIVAIGYINVARTIYRNSSGLIK